MWVPFGRSTREVADGDDSGGTVSAVGTPSLSISTSAAVIAPV